MSTRSQPSSSPIADHIAGECLAVRVRLLNRAITGIYDDALRPLSMTTGQLNLLVAVAKAGPIAPVDIAQLLYMEKSTVSRNLERMRGHGWITTRPNADGRGQSIDITAKGRRQLERATPLWEAAQSEARELLGSRGADSLVAAANRVSDGG